MSFTEYNKNGIIYTLVDGESFTLGGSDTTLNIRSLFLDDNLCAFRGSNNFNYTYNKEESESDDIMADISKNRKLKKNLDPTYKLSCILDNSRNMQNDFLIANWGGIIIDSSGDIILDSSAATVRIGYRVNYDLSDNKQLTYKRFNGGWDENEMEKDIETGNLILDISGHVKFVNGEIKFGHGDYGADNNPEIITIRIDPSNGNIDVSNNIKIYQKLDVSRVDISQVLIIPRRDNSSGDNKYKKSGTGSGISGEIYYDSSENKFFGLYDGKGFKEFGGGSSSNSGNISILSLDKIDNINNTDSSGIYFDSDTPEDRIIDVNLSVMKLEKRDNDITLNISGDISGTGYIRAGHNTDTISYFGRAAIGYNNENSDMASFAHIDNNNSTDYCLLQDQNGGTFLNSKSNQPIEFRQGNSTKMKLDGGNVGIGLPTNTNPDEKLDVRGNIKCTGDINAYDSSDKRLKTNVVPIENPLDKLSKINGYNFEWIENKEVHSNKGKDVGVIAQEINEILPEITITRDNGYMAVRYEKLTAFLVSCVKEQQKIIEEQKQELEEQKEKLNNQEKEILSLKDNITLIMEKINI